MHTAIKYTASNTEDDLLQILQLQQENLPKNISEQEAKEQGFVTLEHNLDLLAEMNTPYPHAIAKNGHKVVGYALMMLPHFFDHAKERVNRPMTDSTGQSVHVDEYTGAANSPARANVSHILSRISKRLSNATAAESIAQWRDVFGTDE